MLPTMSARLKAVIAVAVVALTIGGWLWLRERASPGEKPVEAVQSPTLPASDPAAQVAAPTAPDGRACIPAAPINSEAVPSSPEEAEAMRLAEERTDSERMLEHEDARSRLLASRDPEHLVAAALMVIGPGDRVTPVKQALALGGNSTLVVWIAAGICAAAQDQKACPADELAERLIALDSQNSEAWMLAAVQRLKRADEAGALAAVQRAAAAPESRIYWAETIALVERAYAAASSIPFNERAAGAFGVAAATVLPYSEYMKMCTAQSKVSQAWAHACLGYGEQAERRGDTIIA